MRYKHTPGFYLKQIRKSKEIMEELLDENERILSGEFKGYKTDIYEHTEQWYRHKYQQNKERIAECNRTIVELMKQYCIYN